MLSKILTVIPVILLSSLLGSAQTPMQYNNKLVAITDSLHQKGSRWVHVFKEVKMIKEFSTLTPYRKDLEQYINGKISELKADKDVSGSGELKQAVLEFLDYEKNFVTSAFTPVEQLGESSTDEDIKAAILNINTESQKEGPVLAKVNAAQEAYARKNNFNMAAPSDK